MSSLTLAAARPLYARVSIARLALIIRWMKWCERFTMGLAAVFVISIITQLMYPHDRSLPFMYRDLSLAAVPAGQLDKQLAELNNRIYSVEIEGHTYKLSAQKVGATIDITTAREKLTDYSWKQRLTPFSLFQSRSIKLPVKDEAMRQLTARELAAKHSYGAVDATIKKNPDNSFAAVPAVTGLHVTPEITASALASLGPGKEQKVAVWGMVVEPAIDDIAVSEALHRAAATADSPVHIMYNGARYTTPKEKIAEWIQIEPTEDHQLVVVFDEAAIKAWLNASLPAATKVPRAGLISVVDGAVASRSSATAGEGINTDETAALVAQKLAAGGGEITAALRPLYAADNVVRNYTSTSQGLTALINDWAAAHPSANVSVALQEIGGPGSLGRMTAVNAGQQRTSASVYKLYLATYLLKQLESGALQPDTYIVNGKNIPACIDAMIVVSDNPCGEQLRSKVGIANLDNYLRSLGLTATDLTRIPVESSAADAALFLQKLYGGELLAKPGLDTLLGHMSRQVYRKGIPAATPGNTVYDKVGWLPGVWNDAAIVQGPKTTYVLVIFTSTHPAAINDLAGRIHTLLHK
jgi:beta-lactamase class A